MTFSRVNTVLSIWIILVGIVSIGNAGSMSKNDLIQIANETRLMAESTRDQLQNDPKNKESNGTIAEQFGLIAKQVESIVEMVKPMTLDSIHAESKFIIQSFYRQLEKIRDLLGKEFDEFSHEAAKQQQLLKEIDIQQSIALDYRNRQKSKSIENQFNTFYAQFVGIRALLVGKHGEPYQIGAVHVMKVLDVVETEVTQLTKELKSLTEKYPKQN